MAPELSRAPSKRKRHEALEIPSQGGYKRVQDRAVHTATEHTRDQDALDVDALAETRRIVLKLFCAIEATLVSSLSASSFHSIQQAVRTTARCEFEMPQLAQIIGVWHEVYELESVMALVHDVRTPSLSISCPMSVRGGPSTIARRKEFERRLESWTGHAGTLPDLQRHTQLPLNAAKIASIKKQVIPQTTSSSSPTKLPTSSPSNRERQSALLDRVRIKAQSKAGDPTSDDLKLATIQALIPSAVTSIKILLASRTKKAFGMTELRDNLNTSLAHRISRDDIERLIVVMSESPVYRSWCKVGTVGDVKIVRFVGPAPGTVQRKL